MTIDLKPLDQQVIVVFGASSGIGRATALAAAERCAQVVGAGRDQAALDSLVEETASAPGEVVVGTADADDQGEVEAIAELAVSRFGRIDTWAHVAGIAVYGPFEDITPEEFRRVIDVDLLGPVHGARAALPHLRANGGAFVVVSSEIAKRGFPLATSYSAAKHGVDGFLEALRVELQHAGAPVSVTQVMPAAIATPFFENARSRLGVRASGPPPVYGPEKVAEAILSAAEHPRRDVVVGGAAKVQLAIQRISPLLTDAFVRATAFRLQRSTEAKAPGDDALFDTPEGEDRVRGVVSNTHR
ncbi:MAG: SDR family oxidoreductase [Actinomycetota bacterium]|nr:SDR family oxidoreductase [Actinomycetota bacterium]